VEVNFAIDFCLFTILGFILTKQVQQLLAELSELLEILSALFLFYFANQAKKSSLPCQNPRLIPHTKIELVSCC
jgi:hypothetical protein